MFANWAIPFTTGQHISKSTIYPSQRSILAHLLGSASHWICPWLVIPSKYPHLHGIILGFPWLWGYPQENHPFLDGIFHYKPSSTWGTPIYGNLHMADIRIIHDYTPRLRFVGRIPALCNKGLHISLWSRPVVLVFLWPAATASTATRRALEAGGTQMGWAWCGCMMS